MKVKDFNMKGDRGEYVKLSSISIPRRNIITTKVPLSQNHFTGVLALGWEGKTLPNRVILFHDGTSIQEYLSFPERRFQKELTPECRIGSWLRGLVELRVRVEQIDGRGRWMNLVII